MNAYAKNTQVSIERSQTEIEAVIRGYGATGFLSGRHADGRALAHRLANTFGLPRSAYDTGEVRLMPPPPAGR